MKIIENELYKEDIKYISDLDLPWEKLKNSSLFISGASGLIGSCLVDSIMQHNKDYGLECKIYALGRNRDKIEERFSEYLQSNLFEFISFDINNKLELDNIKNIDYVLHLASNTHPLAYSTDPIGTITTNIIGTNNLLQFAKKHNAKRFVFASSNEIYGENRGDEEKFKEDYCGYINCNTLRAGYTESKRCGEALCQAYIKQENMDIVIPRLTRSYGPTMLMSDTKAMSQFIKKAISKENIVLKSEGNQFYSYTYVVDAVSGLLTVMLKGSCGEAYNISDEKSDITLKELANEIAQIAETKVVFELPSEQEKAGYSKATKARLDNSKLQQLGWKAKYSISDGVKRTISVLKSMSD